MKIAPELAQALLTLLPDLTLQASEGELRLTSPSQQLELCIRPLPTDLQEGLGSFVKSMFTADPPNLEKPTYEMLNSAEKIRAYAIQYFEKRPTPFLSVRAVRGRPGHYEGLYKLGPHGADLLRLAPDGTSTWYPLGPWSAIADEHLFYLREFLINIHMRYDLSELDGWLLRLRREQAGSPPVMF